MSNVTITAGQLFTNCEGGPAIIRVTEVHADGSVTAVHAHLANPITYLPGSLQSQVASGALTEVAPTAPAPLDIPAAIRAYIEAEWRGASHAALSAKRGEITAALLAADPELSNTAAAFRFHKLVDEMRGNDEISAETLARIAPVAERPAVPTVLPGQRVRITGGRFAGIETAPSMIQPSGWLEFTTNSPRGYGIKRQNVAPGNWEPVPYSTGLHEFAPEAGGIICVTPCLRPDGTVQACGDPIKGAIHDPQAYAAYATELVAELAKWAAEPVSSEMLIVGSDATPEPVAECAACAADIVMCPDHCATCNGSSTYAVCRHHDAA